MGLEFLPAAIVIALLMVGWWLITSPQRKHLARQAERLTQATLIAQQELDLQKRNTEFLEASRANAIRQLELMERIANALEQNRTPNKTN